VTDPHWFHVAAPVTGVCLLVLALLAGGWLVARVAETQRARLPRPAAAPRAGLSPQTRRLMARH
jgi:hypothetical protein